MDTLQLTDYAERYIVDRLSVDRRRRAGAHRRPAALRDADLARPRRSSPRAASPSTTSRTRCAAENVELPAGRIESADRDFTLRVARGYQKPEDFAQIPLAKGADGYVVRLGDVARVELASAERRAYFRSNGEPNIGLGIVKTSTANSLDVARAVARRGRADQTDAAAGHRASSSPSTPPPSSRPRSSASTRRWSEAIVLVLLVIWLFLGSVRAALIPAVTVPVCLIAAFIALYAFGFSINLLTLLALVLCIGLVVDDAIVVLENIQRRIDLGEPPLVAAKRGTAQVAFAVIATTAVLVAVFLPVGFLEGNTGRLFRELSVALAGAVAISAFVALTLTPMMSSKLLRAAQRRRSRTASTRWVNARFERRRRALPSRRSNAASTARWLFGGADAGGGRRERACCSRVVPRNWRRPRTAARSRSSIQGPEGAGFDYTVAPDAAGREDRGAADRRRTSRSMRANPRVPGGFGASEEMHTGRVSVFLQDWDKRDIEHRRRRRSSCRASCDSCPACARCRRSAAAWCARAASRSSIVLGGPDYAELAQWRDQLLARMEQNPGLVGAGFRLQGNAPADARGDRPPARRRPRRVGDRHRPRAGDDDGLAPGHHLRRQRRGVRRHRAGRPRRPRHARPTWQRSRCVRATARWCRCRTW